MSETAIALNVYGETRHSIYRRIDRRAAEQPQVVRFFWVVQYFTTATTTAIAAANANAVLSKF